MSQLFGDGFQATPDVGFITGSSVSEYSAGRFKRSYRFKKYSVIGAPACPVETSTLLDKCTVRAVSSSVQHISPTRRC